MHGRYSRASALPIMARNRMYSRSPAPKDPLADSHAHRENGCRQLKGRGSYHLQRDRRVLLRMG